MLERRLLLTAIAASVALPAFAQTSTSQNGAASSGSQDAAAGSATAGSMGAPEQKHLADTAAAGALSLAASRVAVKKARDEDVQQFATFEVAEQETIADVLMSMKDPSKTSGKLKAPSDSEVRQLIDPQDAAMLTKMEQMDGKEFERAYIKAQTQGHERLLQIQETYLAQGKNPAHIGIAKLARGQIKEHLTLLADLRDEEDKSATTGRAPSPRK